MAVSVLDARGLKYPQPTLKVTVMSVKMKPGDVPEVIADCPTFEKDVHWYSRARKTLLWIKEEGTMKKAQIYRISTALICFTVVMLPLLSGCGSNDRKNIEITDNIDNTDNPPLLQSSPYGNSNWMDTMASVIGERKLNEIIIPGTHESGTYGITKDSATAADGNPSPCTDLIQEIESKIPSWLPGSGISCEKVQANWSKAQDMDIVNQLKDGIRYFDLRVYYSEEKQEYQVIHSLVSTDIDTVLNGIIDFYSSPWTSNEIIILDINHTYNMTPERDRELADKIWNKLFYSSGNNVNSSMMIFRCADTSGMCLQPNDLTINKIWELPGRVLFLYNTSDDNLLDSYRMVWPNAGSNNQILSRWPNTNSSGALMPKLYTNAFNDADAASLRKNGGFNVLQAIRTATVDEIKNSVTTALWNSYKGYERDPVKDPIFGLVLVPGVDLEYIWRDNGWCTGCNLDLLDFGSQTNNEIRSADFMDNIAAPAANIVIVDNYQPSKWSFKGAEYGYVDAVKEMNQARFCDPWQGPIKTNYGGWWGGENQGGDIAIGDINGNGKPDLLIYHMDNPAGGNAGYYRIGWDMDEKGNPSSWKDPAVATTEVGGETQGVGVALADLNKNGKPELIVFDIDNPAGGNTGYYRIGWDLSAEGNVSYWTARKAVNGWWGGENQGAGIALYDINKNGKLDLVIFHIDNPNGGNTGYYRIGWDLDENGNATSWTDPAVATSAVGNETQGAGVAVADLNNNGKPELIVFHIDNPEGGNTGYYRIGWDMGINGVPASWSERVALGGWWGNENQGAGIASYDVNNNGRTDMFVFHIDNPYGGNNGYLRIGLDIGVNGSYPQSYCQ